MHKIYEDIARIERHVTELIRMNANLNERIKHLEQQHGKTYALKVQAAQATLSNVGQKA